MCRWVREIKLSEHGSAGVAYIDTYAIAGLKKLPPIAPNILSTERLGLNVHHL